MNRRIATQLACASLVVVGACKKVGDTSHVKFDENVRAELTASLEKLSNDNLESICKFNTMMMFVGNGEDMSRFEYLSAEDEVQVRAIFDKREHYPDKNGPELTDREILDTAIKRARQGLLGLRGIGAKESLCEKLVKEERISRDKLGKLMVAIVTDGPGMNDSTIETTWFGFNEDMKWGRVGDTQYWDFQQVGEEGGKINLAKAKADAEGAPHYERPFELNLAANVSPLAALLSQLNGTKVEDKNQFERIFYLFKTHGSRAIPGDTPRKVTMYDVGNMPSGTEHKLFFDINGPANTKLASDYYRPFWSKGRGCAILKDAAKTDQKAMDKYKSSGCEEAGENDQGLGGTGGSLGGTGGSLGGTGGSLGGTGGSLGGTGGSLGGTGGSLGGTGGSLGGTGGSLGGTGGSLGGTGGSLGGTGGSLGGTGGSLGGTGGSLGGKKGLLFRGVRPALDAFIAAKEAGAKASIEVPQAFEVAGEAAGYTRENIPGIHRLNLPVGTDATTQTMLVLDSCWGSSDAPRSILQSLVIGESIKAGASILADNWLGKMTSVLEAVPQLQRPIWTVSNEYPVGIEVINYGSISASDYMALPMIWEEAHKQACTEESKELICELARKLDSILSKKGLSVNNGSPQAEKAMRVFTPSRATPWEYVKRSLQGQ